MGDKAKTVRAAAYAPDGTEITYTRPPNKWDVAGIAQRIGTQRWTELAHGNSYDSVRSRARTRANRAGCYYDSTVQAVRIWEATAPVVREYFGHHKVKIAEVFTAGKGWEDVKLHGGWSNIRKLSLRGVSSISFLPVSERDRQGVRGFGPAEFPMASLLKSMNLPKQKMCATGGHGHIPATHKISYDFRNEGETTTDLVCGSCAESYSRRPVLTHFTSHPLAP